MGQEARPPPAGWGSLCPGRERPARGSGWGSPGPGLALFEMKGGGLIFRCMAPKPSSQSVPAPVGSSGLPMLTTHLPGDGGPLDCLLGGRGWPSGAGQPAGLENSLSPSLWAPYLGLWEPEICACGQEDRTPPVSSTLAPRHSPRTSWGRATARAFTVLQPCVPVRENLPPLLETGSQ